MNKDQLISCVRYAFRKVDHHPSDTYRHFSFVYNDRDELLGVGLNRRGQVRPYTTGTVHSEYLAIQKAIRRVGNAGYLCINIRLGNDMRIRMACPCTICRRLLEVSGCTKVVYSIDEHSWGEIKF